MSEFNKSYRIRTEVGKDTQLHVKLDQKYDTLELMSLKIDQKNAYRLHTSNYGVIAGRVLANDSFGIPNAKISVFININDEDSSNIVKRVLYPYNTTNSKDKNGVKYNLLPNEQLNDCHTIIGTFPEKQYALDNDSVLEIFDTYYKYTTRTNNAGDYMIFGVPVGSQTIHVDIDLSDIGILSQKPRDMIYKGYNINQFENPNKFKYDTNLNSLTQVISQDNVTDVIPFWGDETEGTIGITRCDINIQYKFEPTCVFMGSVVSDTSSHGISKKCVPAPGMGAMDELTTGSGTIEMIRKKPDGSVEEFQIQGTQLINGDGVWCYQIPMNLDYMMTDEFGNMVPTNDPKKGLPTRTRVRFRISMQDFETDNSNIFRCKMLVPHNPASDADVDYQFGTNTHEDSYRDLFWNGVYSVKSYIPRIQKGTNWKTEKFTGFKRVNYYGDKNPIPYNNIRIRIPFMFTLVCALFKLFILVCKFINVLVNGLYDILNMRKGTASFATIDGTLCNDELENVCIIPGVDINNIKNSGDKNQKGLVARTMQIFAANLGASNTDTESALKTFDTKSIDDKNKLSDLKSKSITVSWADDNKKLTISNVRVSHNIDYIVQCIEMNLAQEYRVMQFDFYNDWINGLIYIPRWVRNITKKHTFLWGLIEFGGKVKACDENKSFSAKQKRNVVQQCGLDYTLSNTTHKINTSVGCTSKNDKLMCHKSDKARKMVPVFVQGGIVKSVQTLKNQFVYYFKPCEDTDGKTIKLYSTDIILLGTMNQCDKWGIPNSLSELLSSTFQMPPNLALTDSDLDGDLYDNTQTQMVFHYQKDQDGKNAAVTNVKTFSLSPNAVTKLAEDGNYTEVSGIEWGYNGPLQMTNVSNPSALYKPGGHFLGLTCRNSETTIKSCVNLARICEYGVWMSQRQELTIPSTTQKTFLNYATVPTGFISKDEISDSVYRGIFATMNLNKLKTVIDPNTGYPIYDFIHVNPTNFGGDLETVMNNTDYNEKVTDLTKETYYDYNTGNEYDSANYYQRKTSGGTSHSITKETQIRRSGEWMDNEYWRFRFGIKETDAAQVLSKKKTHFLKVDTNTNPYLYSFPVYENSYYFYFGLRDGSTALDEFKRQYYAVCQKSESLVQVDNSINLKSLTVTYDGVCSNSSKGEISFYIKTSSTVFGENGVTVKNVTNNTQTTVKNSTTLVKYSNLSAGTYTIYIENETGDYTAEYSIEVKKINITANIDSVHFKRDVTGLSGTSLMALNRNEYGGYIYIKGNNFAYDQGNVITNAGDEENSEDNTSTQAENAFSSGSYIRRIKIVDSKGNSYTNSENNKTEFTYSGQKFVATTNDNGEYMIPVPQMDETYTVELETYNVNCKPGKGTNGSSYWWPVGTVTVNNALPLDFTYGNLSYRQLLNGFLTDGGTESDFTGWWGGETTATFDALGKANCWNLKENLYMNDLNVPHSIKMQPSGGNAPYEDIVSGMKEDLSTRTGLTTSDLLKIECPTINYRSNGKRRLNFSYQVKDVNGQSYPSSAFVFPVIYKPFFTELGIWYFDESNKYYICGNIYNGKTWDYKNNGFDACKLNNYPISNIGTINKDDTVMEFNEPGRGYTGGGYNYNGSYDNISKGITNTFRYNARKVTVSRELDSLPSYGLHSNGPISTLNLTIGSSYTDYGTVYSDLTNTVRTGLELYKYQVTTKQEGSSYKITMEPMFDKNSGRVPDTFVLKDSDYPYPYKNGTVTISDALQVGVMDGTLKSSNLGAYYSPNDRAINVNQLAGATDKIYFLTVPDVNSGKEENSFNILQTVSVSSIINLGTLSKFYPLSISVKGQDTLKETGGYETWMEINADGDDNSKKNFKNKKFVFNFYTDKNHPEIVAHTATVSIGDVTTQKVDLTNFRTLLGLSSGDKTVYFYFDVYDGSEKSPTSYLYKTKDDLYKVIFKYTDNTPQETAPTA